MYKKYTAARGIEFQVGVKDKIIVSGIGIFIGLVLLNLDHIIELIIGGF